MFPCPHAPPAPWMSLDSPWLQPHFVYSTVAMGIHLVFAGWVVLPGCGQLPPGGSEPHLRWGGCLCGGLQPLPASASLRQPAQVRLVQASLLVFPHTLLPDCSRFVCSFVLWLGKAPCQHTAPPQRLLSINDYIEDLLNV